MFVNAVAALLIFQVVSGERAMSSRSDDDRLRELVTCLKESRLSLESGRVVWERRTRENGFIRGRILAYSGIYELVFDGERISVNSAQQRITQESARSNSVDGETLLTERWDGSCFYAAPLNAGLDPCESPPDLALLPRPGFRTYHNLLQEVFRTPAGGWVGLAGELLAPPAPAGATRQVGEDQWNGLRAIRISYSRGADRTDAWHVPEMGGYRVAEDWVSDGVVSYQYRAQVEALDGVWFPTRIQMTSFDRAGVATLTNEFVVDVQRSQFNRGESMSDDLFRLRAAAMTEISDYRSGIRINYVLGRDVPDDAQLRALVERTRQLLADHDAKP